MYNEITNFIKSLYPNLNPVPLHAPVFLGNEKKYLLDCIDSTFVSYVGKYVTKFEEMTAEFTGAKYAVAVVNGTAALQIALQIAGVEFGDEVITQPLTFVATANAISHCGAKPIFVDVDLDTMGMSSEKLEDWLSKNSKYDSSLKKRLNISTNKPISAIVPMHTFGFPCRIDEIVEIGNKYNIPVIEDSAESLGSYYKNKHTGTFGLAGIFSYNGNKTITTGGGGMIITDNEEFAKKAKHITTTAKVPHRWEYVHDEVAYNYRMTNVTAAIGVAQMEKINKYLANKRETAEKYKELFESTEIKFFNKLPNTKANFWLNTILLNNLEGRNNFMQSTNDNGVMTRPIWRLMNKLEMYKNCKTGNLDNSEWFEERVINIPSGYRL
ncbi:MAG: aminotransferase DegT [Stygiobacter sp. RIFOXYC12_FULL_38_8]|nr:MAG: aminotransferase DegT [Stygiobacter sp. RIFOXYA2_FULL_38_8]OGV27310.1 MAG: aminotransferase DegT [Stygiobacter sp. RIFOXYC12_FULL_38_8]